MNCTAARERLLDLQRDRLGPEGAAVVREHLAGCEACRLEAEAEALLDRALAERLPRMPAPGPLRQRIEAMAEEAAAGRARPPPRRRALRSSPAAVAAMGALAAVLAVALVVEHRAGAGRDPAEVLGGEAITDHLRLLASAHPFDLESGEGHEVKPWFEGRLDFAPDVPPPGGELRLLGGSVGYVLDRKAALVTYALRRHRVTLLAFPAAGLAWPAPDGDAAGVPVRTVVQRGFRAVLWRSGDLGYALVSDVSPADLERLAAAFAPATAGGGRGPPR